MTAKPPPAAMLSVYDGRSCAGFILPRGKRGFEAFDASEKSLGVFKTQKEAADVIMGAPRQ